MKKLILSLLCIASLSFATTFEDGVDAFESKDYKTALKVFEELGLKGDIESQYNVGIIYSNGYGIKEDKKKALEWYEKAASQGYVEAQHEVALYFEQGRTVDKNLQKAADLYDSACSSGLEKSCRQYNKLARKGFESSSKKELENGINYYNNKDFKSASEIFINLADKKYAGANFYLGEMYQNGYGLEQNYSKAIEYYAKAITTNKEKTISHLIDIYNKLNQSNQLDSLSNKDKIVLFEALAENKDPEMQFKLAKIYSDGKMIEKNYALSKKWYKEACKNKNKIACYRADVISESQGLYDGDIIFLDIYKGENALSSKDYETAKKIFTRLATENNSSSAKFKLALMYKDKLGINLNDEDLSYEEADKKAFLLLEEVVNGPDSYEKEFAMNLLGDFYFSGIGIQQNYDKAIELYKMAAQKQYGGHVSFKLGNIYEEGIAVKRDSKEALYWYEMAVNNGKKEAKLIVANMYYNGSGTKKDHEKAKTLYEEIFPKEDITLLKNLASIYEENENYNLALQYYKMASNRGDNESTIKYNQLFKKIENLQKTLDRVQQKSN